MSYVGSHIWQVRQKWGKDELITPGAGMLVFNTKGQVLLGFRTDHKSWCHIGGTAEPGQTATETIRRELEEETGLTGGTIIPFGILSVREAVYREYPTGDKFSCWSLMCAVIGIAEGALKPADDEHSELKWFDLTNLPTPLYHETPYMLEAWAEFQKTQRFVLN